jgi:hypothetical protein
MLAAGFSVVILIAVIRQVVVLHQLRAFLYARGLSSFSYVTLVATLSLSAVPLAAFPFREVYSRPHVVVPCSLAVFAAAFYASWHSRTQLPPGGYDYEVEAADVVSNGMVISGLGAVYLLLAWGLNAWRMSNIP